MKLLTLNIGTMGLPEHTTAQDIMDSIAYSFDCSTFKYAYSRGQWEGEDETTIVISFESYEVPDSTILKRLEGLCMVYNQAAIAYNISGVPDRVYAKGLAYHPSIFASSRIAYDTDYFVTLEQAEGLEDSTGVLRYNSDNTPPASRHRQQ